MKSKIEEELKGAGGNKPQITLKKMPHITQSSCKGCPIACAAMLLNYAGIPKSYKDLQRICPSWKRMDFQQLRELLESLGLNTFPVKNLYEAKKLLQEGKPVIVLVNRDTYAKGDNHWVVLRGFKGNVFAVASVAKRRPCLQGWGAEGDQ